MRQLGALEEGGEHTLEKFFLLATNIREKELTHDAEFDVIWHRVMVTEDGGHVDDVEQEVKARPPPAP
jgi:hypothetical protein